MMNTRFMRYAKALAFVLVAFAVAAVPSFAQTTYDLCATTGTVTMPGGADPMSRSGVTPISLIGDCTTGLTATLPGPVLRATAGETLTINLTNNLAEAGLVLRPRSPGRPRAFRLPVSSRPRSAAGGTAYLHVQPTVRAGTFLYHSATEPDPNPGPDGPLWGAGGG